MLLIGEDSKKHIEDFSKQFMNNFMDLLKTTHGEKKVHINQFYQQVIADKTVCPLLSNFLLAHCYCGMYGWICEGANSSVYSISI